MFLPEVERMIAGDSPLMRLERNHTDPSQSGQFAKALEEAAKDKPAPEASAPAPAGLPTPVPGASAPVPVGVPQAPVAPIPEASAPVPRGPISAPAPVTVGPPQGPAALPVPGPAGIPSLPAMPPLPSAPSPTSFLPGDSLMAEARSLNRRVQELSRLDAYLGA